MTFANPVCLFLSAGNEADISNAPQLLCTLTINDSVTNAYRAYDNQAFVDWLKSLGAIPNIPSRQTNKVQRDCDWWAYKERHLVECFWQKNQAVPSRRDTL